MAQDDFYRQHGTHEIPEVDGVEVWDTPAALKMHEFTAVLRKMRREAAAACPSCQSETPWRTVGGPDSCHVVVVEGFMLFCQEDLTALFDLSVVLELSYEESKHRRETRNDREIAGAGPPPTSFFFLW